MIISCKFSSDIYTDFIKGFAAQFSSTMQKTCKNLFVTVKYDKVTELELESSISLSMQRLKLFIIFN